MSYINKMSHDEESIKGAVAYQVDCAVGAQIKKRRLKLGLTQAELAKKVGLNEIDIRQFESGMRRADVFILRQMALETDTEISYFFNTLVYE